MEEEEGGDTKVDKGVYICWRFFRVCVEMCIRKRIKIDTYIFCRKIISSKVNVNLTIDFLKLIKDIFKYKIKINYFNFS